MTLSRILLTTAASLTILSCANAQEEFKRPELAATEQAQVDSDGEWEKEEWSKLSGVWKATMPRGNYRIKRISKGTEVLELYNAEGELLRSATTDMKIERYKGLNFFTVRIGTPLEYTSIYKVHDGKWYEQLRGIFSDTDGPAPNLFIIYEPVEE
jgi:hypothetical protein